MSAPFLPGFSVRDGIELTELGAGARHLYVSPGHNYFGHHGKPAGAHSVTDCERIQCVTGKGIEGDRFFDFKANYKGQVTFFSWETYVALVTQFQDQFTGLPPSASVFRRNIVIAGLPFPVEALIGIDFTFQGVAFRGTAESAPCYWMNSAFCEGAEAALKGRGGLRAAVLSDGAIVRAVSNV